MAFRTTVPGVRTIPAPVPPPCAGPARRAARQRRPSRAPPNLRNRTANTPPRSPPPAEPAAREPPDRRAPRLGPHAIRPPRPAHRRLCRAATGRPAAPLRSPPDPRRPTPRRIPVWPAIRAAPDSRRPPSANSAAPSPPAAPAPGTPATAHPQAASSCPAQAVRRASSNSTVAGSAPFCGPKTRAAPAGPSNGCSTSVAAMTPTPASLAARLLDTAESLDHAAAAVGTATAAESDDDGARAASHGRVDQLTHSPAVGGHRGMRSGRSPQQRQPAGLRAFDVGGSGHRVEHPRRVHRHVQRTAHRRVAHL